MSKRTEDRGLMTENRGQAIEKLERRKLIHTI